VRSWRAGTRALAVKDRGFTMASPWVHHEKTQLNDEELFFQDETLL
jgi:hypothetical protein